METVKGFISSELRYPTSSSKKKKRYVTYHCTKCNKVTETTYQKSSFNNLLGEVQVIETKAMEYTEACKLEHLLMTKLDSYRYKGRQLLVKNGSTELFKQDVSKGFPVS